MNPTETGTTGWIDELVRRMIDELGLDAVELYYPGGDRHLDVNPFKAQEFSGYVRQLSGDQILELTQSVQCFNSAPVQEALRGLHIDVAHHTALMMVHAAAEAALLLHISLQVPRAASRTA